MIMCAWSRRHAAAILAETHMIVGRAVSVADPAHMIMDGCGAHAVIM